MTLHEKTPRHKIISFHKTFKQYFKAMIIRTLQIGKILLLALSSCHLRALLSDFPTINVQNEEDKGAVWSYRGA